MFVPFSFKASTTFRRNCCNQWRIHTTTIIGLHWEIHCILLLSTWFVWNFYIFTYFFCKFQTKDNISLSFCRCSTFVCPTEILAFSERVEEFKKLNTEVIACSVDSHFTHLAWINTPRKEVNIEFSAYFLQYYYHAK